MWKITIAFGLLVFCIFGNNSAESLDPMLDDLTGLFDFKPSNRISIAKDLFSDPQMMYRTLYKTILCDDAVVTETISEEGKIQILKPYIQLFKQLSIYQKPNADFWTRMEEEKNSRKRNPVLIKYNKIQNVNYLKSNDNYIWSIFKQFNLENQ